MRIKQAPPSARCAHAWKFSIANFIFLYIMFLCMSNLKIASKDQKTRSVYDIFISFIQM